MKKYIRSVVAALLSVVILLSATYIPVIAVSDADTQYNYSSSSNSGKRNEVATTLNGTGALDYYGNNYSYDKLSTLSKDDLFNSLNSLMSDTHNNVTSYNDCKKYVWRTDCEENNTTNAITLYNSYKMDSGDWEGVWYCNREHVWPQSLGGGTSGGGADLHHIRPALASVNSSRGNKKYGYGSGQYVPADNVKGDVARIVLYIWVRWNSQWGADSVTEVFQRVDVLLEWCELDPVDTWEMGRNEVVEGIQGNRNVFIDYPEYAWLVFGREIPADMVTPSGEAAKGNGSGNNGSGSDDPIVPTVCTHTNTVIKGAVQADCHNDGYTGDIYCADCDKLISNGSQIPVTNAHSFGDWEISDDGSYVKHCSICGATASLTLDSLIGSIDSDAEKILILLTLGVTDSALLDALAGNN